MSNNRPLYHLTADKNWINDPNGLIFYKGFYHVFYQHHPFGLDWGPMHWGHQVSKDLLHWEHLPFALTPGNSFDKDGCFSGSSIVVNDRLYIFYTGFINNEDPEKIRQQQCIAYSDDGIHFTKGGLVIGEDKLPKEFAPNDFRDPCVFVENDRYVMLVAARRINGRGNILRYESFDLLHWEFVTAILKEDSKGTMIECPDYIKDLNLLTYCEQFQPVEGYLHHNLHTNIYEVGEFVDKKFMSFKKGMIDYGFDFYAPQFFMDKGILIAWMNMWDRNNPSKKYGFTGSMTIPRKVEVVNNELLQTPVMPQNVLYELKNVTNLTDHVVTGFYRLEIEGLKSFSLKLRKGDKHETSFVLFEDEWVFNRSRSGDEIAGKEKDSDSVKGIRRMPLKKLEKHTLYVVLDKFSVELFVDGVSMTSLIYPNEDEDLLQLKIQSNLNLMTRFKFQFYIICMRMI